MKINTTGISLIVVLLSLVLLFFTGKKNKQRTQSIENNGIETIGTVVNRTQGIGNGGITIYGVWFDFYIDGELIRADQLLEGKKEYDKAIVGMKYKVKYLPDKPNTNSIILINEPIIEYSGQIEPPFRRKLSHPF